MPDDTEWMTAGEACEALGITRATLYAYVSRGFVESKALERVGRGKVSVYSRASVDARRATRAVRPEALSGDAEDRAVAARTRSAPNGIVVVEPPAPTSVGLSTPPGLRPLPTLEEARAAYPYRIKRRS